MNPKEQMKKVKRNLGIGEVGGGSHERPEAKSLVKAEATARDGGLGGAGVAEKKNLLFHFSYYNNHLIFDKIR